MGAAGCHGCRGLRTGGGAAGAGTGARAGAAGAGAGDGTGFVASRFGAVVAAGAAAGGCCCGCVAALVCALAVSQERVESPNTDGAGAGAGAAAFLSSTAGSSVRACACGDVRRSARVACAVKHPQAGALEKVDNTHPSSGGRARTAQADYASQSARARVPAVAGGGERTAGVNANKPDRAAKGPCAGCSAVAAGSGAGAGAGPGVAGRLGRSVDGTRTGGGGTGPRSKGSVLGLGAGWEAAGAAVTAAAGVAAREGAAAGGAVARTVVVSFVSACVLLALLLMNGSQPRTLLLLAWAPLAAAAAGGAVSFVSAAAAGALALPPTPSSEKNTLATCHKSSAFSSLTASTLSTPGSAVAASAAADTCAALGIDTFCKFGSGTRSTMLGKLGSPEMPSSGVRCSVAALAAGVAMPRVRQAARNALLARRRYKCH